MTTRKPAVLRSMLLVLALAGACWTQAAQSAQPADTSRATPGRVLFVGNSYLYYNESPVGNSYDYYGRIDKDTASFLQKVADDTVRKFSGR